MPITKTNKKKDGLTGYRVRVNYTDSGGKHRQVERMAYGLAEAKDLETKLNIELSKAALPSSMTVQKLYDEYILYKKHEVRVTTLDKTDRMLRRYILPLLKDIKLEKLNVKTLQKWKNDINELDKTKGEEGKLGITTKKNIYGELRTMLNYAVKMEYIPQNPISKLGNFKDVYINEKLDEFSYYTPEQFKKYIECAKPDSNILNEWSYYVFFNIAYYTGMRKGEINALKWTDIDGDIIHVRRSVAQKLKGIDVMETAPKNKSSIRSLQIPIPLKNILDEHLLRQKQFDEFTKDWRVCGGPSCIPDNTLRLKNIEFADNADLPHIRVHDFRHSHASVLANNGINIQEIARRLGHSKIEITWNTYSHLYPREQERALNILNQI